MRIVYVAIHIVYIPAFFPYFVFFISFHSTSLLVRLFKEKWDGGSVSCVGKECIKNGFSLNFPTNNVTGMSI